MHDPSLGHNRQAPELDFQDHEVWRERHRRLSRASTRVASPTCQEHGRRPRDLAAQPASAPRVRHRPYGEVARVGRSDGKRMLLEAGVVELVNQPGFKFDYRIAMRLVDDNGDIRLEPHAVAVIARDGGLPATSGNLRNAAIGAAIIEAGRRLTHEEPHLERRADAGVVQAVMRTSGEPRGRASRAQVHRETQVAVARVQAGATARESDNGGRSERGSDAAKTSLDSESDGLGSSGCYRPPKARDRSGAASPRVRRS